MGLKSNKSIVTKKSNPLSKSVGSSPMPFDTMQAIENSKSCPMDKIEDIFQKLSGLAPPELTLLSDVTPSSGIIASNFPDNATPYVACSSPNVRIMPEFIVTFRRPLQLCRMPLLVSKIKGSTPYSLDCIGLESPTGLEFLLGLDLTFNQIWRLTELRIGDLESTMGLAPSEQLTLEFQSSQRKLLDQTTENSSEETTSTESTTMDKEVANVINAMTKTRKWNIDGHENLSLQVPVGGGTIGGDLGVSGSLSESIEQSSKSSIEHVTESTVKTSHNLKTTHKILVRGVTEGLISNRMSRIIKNPFPDRTLSLNVFQLLKHFFVKTEFSEIRLALILKINGLNFDAKFILSYSDFLKNYLMDSSLIDQLQLAYQAVNPPKLTGALEKAINLAKTALRFLYGIPEDKYSDSIFNLPSAHDPGGRLRIPEPNDPNTVANSLNANISFNKKAVPLEHTGFGDAQRNSDDLIIIFCILNVYYKAYGEMLDAKTIDNVAIDLATSLDSSITPFWANVQGDKGKIQAILDNQDLTEIFRRLPAFLSMVEGMIKPLLDDVKADMQTLQQQQQNVFALEQLLSHLRCNNNYYTQKFLKYVSDTTNNQAIIDFVTSVIDSTISFTKSHKLPTYIYQIFDVGNSFIDQQQIIVPAYWRLDDSSADILPPLESSTVPPYMQQKFDSSKIKPTIVELDIPTDGIHLEVSDGGCILSGINSPPNSASLTIQNADFKINAP